MENFDFVAFVLGYYCYQVDAILNSEIYAKLNNLVDLGDVYQ